jgi:transitional endoplasmic reticulum ATPase
MNKEDKSPILKLKVAEAMQDDVNKGIVRVDSNLMKEIGLSVGSFIEIEGQRKTVCIVDRGLPGDMGLNIIRMDGISRRNAKTSIGEIVKIKKFDIKEAKKVTIAPAKEGITIKANPIVFKNGLLGRAVAKNDLVALGGSATRKRTMATGNNENDFNAVLSNAFSRFGLGDIKFVVTHVDPKNENALVTENTVVEFDPTPTSPEEEKVFDTSYEDIGGLEDEVAKVREMIELPLKHPQLFQRLGIQPPRGVLLHGPPGTGKTLLAKAVANETDVHFINLRPSELISPIPGATEKKFEKVFQDAERNEPSIIFIDEIDSFAFKRESRGANEFLNTPVIELLRQMDGLKSRGGVVVIAATNRPNALDTALRRPGRFDREIEIGIPDQQGREKILKIHTRSMPLAKAVKLKKISEVTHGFVGADLEALTKEAAMIVMRRLLPELRKLKEGEDISENILNNLLITQKDFIDALKFVRPSAMREVLIEIPKVTWDDIGGLIDVKQELIEAVEWPLKHKDAFERLGVKPPKGILMYGPPGTGKTLLAKAISHESGANFISVKGPEVLSKWVNETPKLISNIFKKARQASPCIIFIDEIDSITARRDSPNAAKTGMSAVETLLTEMDGLEALNDVIVVAATNRPDIVDTALLRPGRFDRIVLVGVPDKESRKKIFDVHTKDMALAEDVKITNLVDLTDGYVGADIEAVCREAAILTLRKDIKAEKVKMEFFNEALKKVGASVNKEIEDAYKELKNQFSQAKGQEFKKEKPNYYG